MGMAVIKCKMCGGDMELSPDKTLGTCEYCGSTMTMPKVDDDQRAAAFDRGNHFRRLGEFDKALSVYERIVQEDESDAEAHWCCALCRFGIEYVKDPATGEYLPTCHRASFDSFLEDVDYKAAVAHADAVARKQYEKEGEQIAAVQRGILSTVQKEEPFDVFICYKESDEQGRRTVDSTLAQDIYYQLTEQGRRVFFARITLEDKAGQEYEPYIFAALHSAKVMVVVGTKPEYLNAAWVKNEWSRYLALMKQDHKRLLIPCYRGMDPYDLPEQLSVLQSYDTSKIGFIQDLIRGIGKVLDVDKKPERTENTVTAQGEGGNLSALLKRGNMALEDGEWSRADEFFEQVLNLDAECAEAYFGKALGLQKCHTEEELINKFSQEDEAEAESLVACEEDKDFIEAAVEKYAVPGYLAGNTIRKAMQEFDRSYPSKARWWKRKALEMEKRSWEQDKNMARAVRFAKGEFAQRLNAVKASAQGRIQENLAAAEQADREEVQRITAGYSEYLKEAERNVAARYETALKRQQEAQEQARLREEHARRQKEREERAAEERRKREEQEAEERRKQEAKRAARNKKIGIVVSSLAAVAIVAWVLVTQVIIPSNRYKAAEELLAAGDYDGAAAAFEALGDYQDSAERIPQLRYQQAEELLAAGDYDSAAAVFGDLGNYQDSAERIPQLRYQQAEELLAEGDIVRAAMAFGASGNYSDAQARSRAAWDRIAKRDTLSAGNNHTVGLKSDGTVVAVGDNNNGQCNVDTWTDIVAVFSGDDHTVGLKSDGTVVAVGYDYYGQCDVDSWTNIKLPNQ